VGGNNPGSDCETQVAFYESLGCTVGYSDTPNGPEDTLTVDCSAGTPQSEYESPNTAAVSPTLRRGNGNKANPPVLRQVQQSFTCTSFSQGIGTAGYHTEESERICNASLTRQVDAWADRVYNVATVSGKFTHVRSTTRCNEANLLSYVREFGPPSPSSAPPVTSPAPRSSTPTAWTADGARLRHRVARVDPTRHPVLLRPPVLHETHGPAAVSGRGQRAVELPGSPASVSGRWRGCSPFTQDGARSRTCSGAGAGSFAHREPR
jgi:hypothetical protein